MQVAQSGCAEIITPLFTFSSGTGMEISPSFHFSTSIRQQLAPIEWALLICDLLDDSRFTQPPRSADFPGSPTGS